MQIVITTALQLRTKPDLDAACSYNHRIRVPSNCKNQQATRALYDLTIQIEVKAKLNLAKHSIS